MSSAPVLEVPLQRGAERVKPLEGKIALVIGRAVAALTADSNVMSKPGRVFVNAGRADEYHFDDVDGKRPTSSRFTLS